MSLTKLFGHNVSFDNQSVLVTGGTGSFGKTFVDYLLKKHSLKRLIIFSRDELKQFEMQAAYPREKYPNLRFFIGDVRDPERMRMATKDVDLIVHAAALKQVIAMEYNPFECIQTNIMGAQNIVTAALENNVKKVLALSTDKAAEPINLYGASKLASDKIFTAANNLSSKDGPKFSCVRYGNVISSRGSVVPFFSELIAKGTDHLPITHEEMTRFVITLDQGVSFVCAAIEVMRGGELFIPKIPSVRIMDLAEAMAPELERRVVGIRPGEKLHEVLLPAAAAHVSLETNEYYIIKPELAYQEYEAPVSPVFEPVDPAFSYASDNNPKFLSVPEIRTVLGDLGLF